VLLIQEPAAALLEDPLQVFDANLLVVGKPTGVETKHCNEHLEVGKRLG
jgi:hypothetical protein